jgi:ketosteroid isomerase-like protein
MTAPFAHAWIVRGDRISRFIQYTDTIKIREAMS